PTTMAVINPKLGKFNVTAKGGLVQRSYFDTQIAKPYLFLLLLNLTGMVAELMRLAFGSSEGELQTLWLNLGWTAYNMTILGATIATCSEQRQVRRAHRVPLRMPAVLHLPDGTAVPCHTVDFSTGGMALRPDEAYPVAPGTEVHIELGHRGRSHRLPAVVRHDRDDQGLSIEFAELNLEQERWLVASTFARADLWMSQWGHHDRDTFLGSLGGVMRASVRGFVALGRHIASSSREGFRRPRAGDNA